MSKKVRITRRIMNIIAAAALALCVFLGASSITYALVNQDKPDVIVHIDRDGKVVQSGDMYSNVLWYPGFSKSGIIRVENSFKRIKVTDLGLNVEITNVPEGTPVYKSFLSNMILTISRGRFLVFNEVILKDKSFYELLNNAENKNMGSQLGDSGQFYIENGESIDLKYDLYMDPDSGDELENITANVAFCVNMDEIPIIAGDESEANDDGTEE